MLLIAFYGKFCSFYKLSMPKIVESIQAQRIRVKLSITDQRPEGKKSRKCHEIRATINLAACENFTAYEIFAGCTVHPAKFASCVHCFILQHCSPFCHYSPFLLFDAVTFLLQFFGFFPILSLIIAFGFVFFCNFPCSEQYKSPRQALLKGSSQLIKTLGGSFSRCFPFLLFSFLFSPFLGYQTLL